MATLPLQEESGLENTKWASAIGSFTVSADLLIDFFLLSEFSAQPDENHKLYHRPVLKYYVDISILETF